MRNILIVEDERAIAELVSMNLTLAGYTTEQSGDGSHAIELLHSDALRYDLLLVDVMLPGADGFAVLRTARHYDVPVVMLTARSDLADKVHGLHEGADDYVTKPFESLELLARVEAVLRRSSRGLESITVGDVSIDLERREVTCRGALVDLTSKEYSLLHALALSRNKALSRETILSRVWGSDFVGESRAVDVHIQRLRKKLGGAVDITTVYKYGYRLDAQS